jgi:ubiquinone/menaquinone biosynthesis C-methylase UbiE
LSTIQKENWMKILFDVLLKLVIGLPVFAVLWLAFVRLVRHFYKFPMPEFMAPVIDNPFRRRFQPPEAMPIRHALLPGMRVLEVGPGNGRYTLAAAHYLGPQGKLVAIDIEPRMIKRLNHRIGLEGASNVVGQLANVYTLPFEDNTFDAAYMITVIGEIPEPIRAMQEFYRVLRPGGILAFSELFLDPDYPLARTLIRQAETAGFRLKARVGNWWTYSVVFEK